MAGKKIQNSSKQGQVFTPSNLRIFSRSSFYLSLKARGGAAGAPRNATLSHEMDVGRQKLRKNCDLT